MEEKKDVFFVGMEHPHETRDSLMSAWKDIVESMERFEKFKEIREERSVNIEKFRSDMRDIFKLISQLNSRLPKIGVHIESSLKKKEHQKKADNKVKISKKPEAKEKSPLKTPQKKEKRKSELDELESELDDIESKIGSL